MATETQHRTHCPTCGAKIARQDLSICSYCATPLDLVDPKPKAKDSEIQKRLEKMKEHELFEGAIGWTPPESAVHHHGESLILRGIAALVVGVVILGFALLSVADDGVTASQVVRWIGGGALTAVGVFLFLKGRGLQHKATMAPLLRRCAMVTDRRSETEVRGLNGTTTYYFTLELEDGTESEFGAPGLGANHEPLVKGNTGIAFTRGQALLGFKQIRV